MGLFDELNDQPTIGNDLEDFEAGLNKDPVPSQQTLEEYKIAQQFAVNEAIDSPETISLKRQGAALATEILISGGGQVAGAVATGGSAGSIVGAPAAPFVWIGTTFTTGYTANVAAQAIEDPNGVKEFSHGRAIAAGLINTIPFVGKFTKGTKAAKIAEKLRMNNAIALQGAQGGAMAAGDTTIRLAIDEQRLPTLKELGYATGFGIGVGAVLGGGIEGAKPVIKKMTPSVKRFYGKIAGKTPEEIDAMIKKGELLPEEVEDAMEEISKDPNAKPDAPEQPIYKILEEDIGDVHTRSLRELAEDVDPRHLQKHADRLSTHPEIVALRNKAKDAGQSTLDRAGGKFDDIWKTERGWLAKVDELYGTGAPRKERKALIIAGGTASGKSTLADQDADALGAKIIDSDYAKELLPEYDGGNGAGLVHQESKEINALVLDRALDNGDNIILPIVGSSGGSIKNTINLLKSEGYEVAFKYVDVPEAVAQARNFRRIHRTGRFVDPEYVTNQYKKIAKNYESGKSNSSHSQRVTNENDTIEILEQGGKWKDFFDSGDVLTGGSKGRGTDGGTNEQATSQKGATIQDYWDGLNSHLEKTRGWNIRQITNETTGALRYQIFNKESGKVVGEVNRKLEDGVLNLDFIGAAIVDGKRLKGQGIVDSVYSFDAQFRKQNNLGVKSDLTSPITVKKFEQYHGDIPTVRKTGEDIDDGISIEKRPEAPATPKDAPTENVVTPDINPNYKKGGGQKKIVGYKVKAKDGRELYIESRPVGGDLPKSAKFLVSMGDDGLAAFPTKKEALDWIDSTNEIKTPQPSATPQTSESIAPDQQAVRAAIDEVDSILVNQTDGNAYNVTKKVKAVFTSASEEIHKDIRKLIETGDIEIAKRLLARLPNYIELDRKVSKKDFAQATGLKANDKNAKLGAERLKAGITATNNQRTLNLRRLGEMLEELIEDGVPIRDKDVKGLQAENKQKASGTRLTKEERLDEIQSHLLETFTKERSGTLQKVLDAYFSVRLVQLLNSFKTATVGTVSAVAQTALRPAVNTVVNTRKLLSSPKLKDKTIGQKTRYVMSDIIATQEYLYTVTKHLGNTMRSVGNTIKNRGESAFLHLDKHSYVQGEINAAQTITRSEKAGFTRAKRRNDARVQADGTMKTALQIKAKVLNNPIVRAPLFFYDYGLALIGGFEEISLIAHSLRSQRARGIKKGIEEGADDIGKYADDYVESSIDRSSGTFKAKYDAGFAEDFNVARRDHFRRLDVDPDDIRKGWDESVINTLQKMSKNPDEVGLLIKILYPILGVPLRATGYAAKYVPPVAGYRLGMKAVGRGVSALEKQTGDGVATFGKFNRAISEAEADIKLAREQIKNPASTADEIAEAKKLLRDKEGEAARYRDYQMTDDAEALAFASIGMAFFVHSYMSAKQGDITGTMAMYDDEQKKALYAGQGAQQAYRMNLFGEERDFRYADPIKLAMALGADWAHRQELADNNMLREDQKGLKGLIGFTSNFVKAMITEMPTSRGIKNLSGVFSGDPDKQIKGVGDSFQSLVPVPSEIRRARTAGDEFVSDRTQGNVLGNAVDQALGKEAANYRLTWLGEPKKRDADTVSGYFFTMGAKKPVELEPIDKVYLSDSLLQQTISHTPTTINKLALKEYMNEDGESLYSLYGRLVSTTKLGGMTLRQRLNSLVSDPNWKSRFALGYDDDPKTGQETNIAIEQVKEILSKYRAHAKKQILKTSVAQDYYKDGSNIYTEMNQRKEFKASNTNILEVLNIE